LAIDCIVFGPRSEEVMGERKKQQELNGRYSSPNVQVIKFRRMRWAGHVACMGRGDAYKGYC
jgi:hypothetical protein